MITVKNYQDNYAYDIGKNVITKPELKDTEAINQSIEMILSTYYGERVFNPSFGSLLPAILFENLTKETANKLIDSIVVAIKRWEDRVIVLENQVKMVANRTSNSIELTIPYVIKKNNIVSIFNKKVIL